MLLDVESGEWSQEACDAFDIDVASLAPVREAHAVLGPVAPWLRDAAGLDPSTQVVLGCGDDMAATLGAGVVEPGVVCDVMGTAEPVCAVVPGTGPRPRGHHRAPPACGARRLAAREPRLAVGRGLPLVPRRAGVGGGGQSGGDGRRRLRASELPGGGRSGRGRRGALGARARAERPHPNGTQPRGQGGSGSPQPTAALTSRGRCSRATPSRCATCSRRSRPRASGRSSSSASRAARAAICCGRSARTSPACPSPGRTTSRRPPGAPRCSRPSAPGCTRTCARPARAMAGPRSEPLLPRPGCSEVYEALYRRHRELYAALRPLFS